MWDVRYEVIDTVGAAADCGLCDRGIVTLDGC